MKENYKANKVAQVGTKIKCPNCNSSFIKKNHNQTFCQKLGKTKCRDNFWNTYTKPKRENSIKIERKKTKRMAVTFYLSDNEYKEMSFIKDEINDLFQDVRRINPNLYVGKCIFYDKTWYGKKIKKIRYSVFNRIENGNEAQCLLVPSMHLTYRELYAYLFGVLHSTENQKTKP